MSWCTYRMSDSSKHLLQNLSARCGEPTTTDDLLVSIARLGLPHVDTVLALKEWLLQQLLCQVDGKVLPNYCGVLGEFLMDLPLPRIIYMLDYSRGHFIRPCPPPKIQPPKAAPKQRPMPA